MFDRAPEIIANHKRLAEHRRAERDALEARHAESDPRYDRLCYLVGVHTIQAEAWINWMNQHRKGLK